MKIQNAPLYALSYRRDGKDYADKTALFANWTPDTLDKSLYKKDQEVEVVYTKLRNHTVGEALKDTLSDVGPAVLLMVPLMGAVGTLVSALAGAGPMVGMWSGAGLAAGLTGMAGVVSYNSLRSDVGQKTFGFSGYAYRERADQKEVKLISGWDLAFKQDDNGFMIGGAAPTAHGSCEIKSLGRMP